MASWISRSGALTQSEMENNADIVIPFYRNLGYSDKTIGAILGNMQAESSINPERQEVRWSRLWDCSMDASYSFTRPLYYFGNITI